MKTCCLTHKNLRNQVQSADVNRQYLHLSSLLLAQSPVLLHHRKDDEAGGRGERGREREREGERERERKRERMREREGLSLTPTGWRSLQRRSYRSPTTRREQLFAARSSG